MKRLQRHLLVLVGLTLGCATTPVATRYDAVIRNGWIYDGSGSAPRRGDVAINGDTIAAVGDIGSARGTIEIDARGRAVTPGFINALSWATESLIIDGRSQADIRQGVTLEVFGEGWSMGPFTEPMKQEAREQQTQFKYEIEWTTLGEYLDFLVRRGISPNVASFIGATTVRIHELGYEKREPSAAELERMKDLVRQAMREGALGVGSSLIYAPATYAGTPELIELNKAAAESGGTYISHMRSEGNHLLEGIDELISIAREANIAAEIYHLKAAGEANWPKMDAAIRKVNDARAAGLSISANMYTYPAGGTGLDALIPSWAHEGGLKKMKERLRDPALRLRIVGEMRTPAESWENLGLLAGSPDRILFSSFGSDALKPLVGKSLAEVAGMRGKSPEDTAIDLLIEDDAAPGAIFFLMSEENIRKGIAQSWVSFGSDAESPAPEGVFLSSNPHPRAYGNFARLLGKYVREEKVIPFEEAIRRLTSLPATKFKIDRRGFLRQGYFADVVVLDPASVADHATFENPHQYSTGVSDVFVNGVQVLRDGEHTGAKPGRVVRGPGYVAQSR
ncbi:MAG TPA: D-aminoacylase [Thermoanaerobaculia bacterium]|jgi:N-acyl-D-amino-acid deacylase|nr:D-aminoacylase [Thermoanaerobaculia bacterium]